MKRRVVTSYLLPPLFSVLSRGKVKPVLGRFSELNNLLPASGLGPGTVDAALLDAGCSSMQMDSAERGFSLSKDGPLDMRMDRDRLGHFNRNTHCCCCSKKIICAISNG